MLPTQMKRTKQDVLDAIVRNRVVAIVRTDDSSSLVGVARALYDGGISLIEITMTVPGAIDVIRRVEEALRGEDVYLGAGTVLTPELAEAAIDAGAQFIVSPSLNVDTVSYCNQSETIVLPGAFTPTEVEAAWKAGADIVKVFPANVAGPGYLKDLLGPLPDVRLLATGNVNFESAAEYLANGAVAVGVGGILFGGNLIDGRDFMQIKENARRMVACLPR